MKIVFLDIDGVLNRSHPVTMQAPSGVRGIEDPLVENLAGLIRQAKADIVLTSDWKVGWCADPAKCSADARYLDRKMADHGLCIMGKTYDNCVFDEYYTCRGTGIRKFLDDKRGVDGYVVLDDHDFMDFDAGIREHFVKTNSLDGLTKEKAEEALRILNNGRGGMR